MEKGSSSSSSSSSATATTKNAIAGFANFVKVVFLRKKAAKIGSAIILFYAILIILGPNLVPYSPYATSASINSPPSASHLLGTDYLGHDVLSQVIWGAYPSMIVAILAAIGGALLGLIVGVFAGYFSKIEGALTGISDIVLTFPPLPLLVLVGLLYAGASSLLVLILILVLWPPIARAVRSQILSVKNRPYVDAARSSGLSDFEIIKEIMIPSVASITFAYFVLNVAVAVILVTGLEYFGIGNPEIVSWGSMFYWAQQFAFYSGDWWWIFAPGIAVTTVATAFALIGFSVEEIANPRLRV